MRHLICLRLIWGKKREKYRNIVYISKCLRHSTHGDDWQRVWCASFWAEKIWFQVEYLFLSWIGGGVYTSAKCICKVFACIIFFIFIFMENKFTEQSFDSMLLFFFCLLYRKWWKSYGNHYKIASEITIKWKSTRGIWNKIPTEENKMLQWAHTLHAMRAYVPHITFFHLKWLQCISFTWKFLGFCPRTDLSFNASKPHG